MSKWGSDYWQDFLERCGATLIYGVITYFTLDQSTSLNFEELWPVVFLPTLLNALKNLLVNLGGTEPTASVIKVSSKRVGEKNELGITAVEVVLLCLGIAGFVIILLALTGNFNNK